MSQLPALLAGELKRLDTELVWLSLRGGPVTPMCRIWMNSSIGELDCALPTITNHSELCQATLQRWLLRRVMMLDALSQDERRLLIATIWQYASWSEAGCPTGCRRQTCPDKSIALPCWPDCWLSKHQRADPASGTAENHGARRTPWPSRVLHIDSTHHG